METGGIASVRWFEHLVGMLANVDQRKFCAANRDSCRKSV